MKVLRTRRTGGSRALRLGACLALALTVGLIGCSRADPILDDSPVTLTDAKAADGTAVKQVALTDHAVQRLAITTGTVQVASATVAGVVGQRKVVPYAAIVYDSDGSTWAYVQNGKGSYVRARVVVAAIQGTVAVLTDGPAEGTLVVTQGAPELLGAEAEIAGEQ